MLRLAAPPPQRLEQATSLDVQIGGSEANVAAACARLGSAHGAASRRCRASTPGAIGRCGSSPATASTARGVLRRPGRRLGLYFLEYGAAPRARCACSTIAATPRFSRLVPDDVDWALVRRARCSTSPESPRRSGRTCATCPGAACDEAEAAAVHVSLDVNYRSRLWSAEGGAGLPRRGAARGRTTSSSAPTTRRPSSS